MRVGDLDDDEARELGPLLSDVSAALRDVVGCEKTYVVPRQADLPEAHSGPRVFGLLGDSASWTT